MVSLCSVRLGPRTHSPLERVSKTTDDEYGFLPWQNDHVIQSPTYPERCDTWRRQAGTRTLKRSQTHCVPHAPGGDSQRTDHSTPVANGRWARSSSFVTRTPEPVYDNIRAPMTENTSFATSAWSTGLKTNIGDHTTSDVHVPRRSHEAKEANVAKSTDVGKGRNIARSHSLRNPVEVSASQSVGVGCDVTVKSQAVGRDVTRSQSFSAPPPIHPLQAVSFPEYTPMIITQSYDPSRDPGVSRDIPGSLSTRAQLLNSCVSVTRGEIVSAISRRGDSILVQTFTGRFGYVPASCVHPIKAILRKCKRDFCQQFPEGSSTWTFFPGDPDRNNNPDSSILTDVTALSSSFSSDSGLADSSPASGSSARSSCNDIRSRLQSRSFRELQTRPPRVRTPVLPATTPHRRPCYIPSGSLRPGRRPRLTVLFDYDPAHDGEARVRRQDIVTLLSNDTSDWLYVQTSLGMRGYIPRSHAIDLTALNLEPSAKTTYL